MPDLDFQPLQAQPIPHAAAPHLAFSLRISQRPRQDQPPTLIHSVLLRCQIRLEPGRRRYTPSEQEKLVDLFGEPSRWAQTVRSTLWANVTIVIPSFTDAITVEMPVPCTYDFNVATAKYFHALGDGEVPLCLLFSGTIFYAGEQGALQVAQISWEKEAAFRLHVETWKQMMEIYYPDSAWLCLPREQFQRLSHFKSRRGLATWEQALTMLLDAVPEEVPA